MKQRAHNNYAFIDSQNLNLGIQKMGWKLDWRKFREMLTREYGVSKAYMFIGYMQENEALYEQMHDLGYLIVLKPTVVDTHVHVPPVVEPQSKSHTVQTSRDKSKPDDKKSSVKGNTDADMVLYILKELPNYDKAIIVSGDGDFFSTVEYLIGNGRLQHLMTPNWQYSSLLKEFESFIIRLDTKRRQLAYRQSYQRTTKKSQRNTQQT